jgi:hypothetical protein
MNDGRKRLGLSESDVDFPLSRPRRANAHWSCDDPFAARPTDASQPLEPA